AMRAVAAFFIVLACLSGPADAQNTPCSGKKGGISHCEGDTFVCKDGSASGSKRSCPAYLGGSNQLAPAPKPSSGPNAECSCASKNYCTGPRGGRYCMTSTGSKRYVRR